MNEFEFKPDGFQGLEAFPNPEPKRRYRIDFTCPEWTALCPHSNFPDFGVIHITYEPRELCVELKSLKLYINSYRSERIWHEAAVNRILTDLVKVTRPWKMDVRGDFNVRGNIKTIIEARYQAPDYDVFVDRSLD
jgi:7-cyano-7-deazaguanine reductase